MAQYAPVSTVLFYPMVAQHTPELVAQLTPETLAQLTPEKVAQYAPEYPKGPGWVGNRE